MTVAKRIVPIVEFTRNGAPAHLFRRGGMDVHYVETATRFLVNEGADEIWLRLNDPDERGAGGLFDLLKTMRATTFVPLVAWGAIRSASDARLVIGMGADRVVLDAAAGDPSDVLRLVNQVAQSIGGDRVTVALGARRVAAQDSFRWELTDGKGEPTGNDAVGAALALIEAGACELLLSSWFQRERGPHPTDLIERLSAHVPCQILSTGKASGPEDLAAPLLLGADGVAAADQFCDGTLTVAHAKAVLAGMGLPVRPAVEPYI